MVFRWCPAELDAKTAVRMQKIAMETFEALGVRQDDKLTIAAGPDTCTAWVVSASGHTLTIDAEFTEVPAGDVG